MNTETLITAGPWKAEFDAEVPRRGRVYVEGPSGWKLQPICAADFGDDVGVNEANARLIAAAPDLLEVARLLASWDHCWPGNINLESVSELARSALAKAVGAPVEAV